MKELIDLIRTFSAVEFIVFVAMFILMAKGLLELVTFVKEALLKWYKTKKGIEDKDEGIENRIKTLEEHDDWKYNKILDLEVGQNAISNKLDDLKERNRLEVIAQYRSTIYRLYKEFTAKGYMTESEYEMFRNLADIYLEYGGNGYYRHHVIPEIEALPIRE